MISRQTAARCNRHQRHTPAAATLWCICISFRLHKWEREKKPRAICNCTPKYRTKAGWLPDSNVNTHKRPTYPPSSTSIIRTTARASKQKLSASNVPPRQAVLTATPLPPVVDAMPLTQRTKSNSGGARHTSAQQNRAHSRRVCVYVQAHRSRPDLLCVCVSVRASATHFMPTTPPPRCIGGT